MNYDQLKELSKSQTPADQGSGSELFRAIYKRKIPIIISFVVILALGIFYLKTASPVYESSVLLKKVDNQQNSNQDPYKRLMALESQDDISTEIALVKTRSVLDKVVKQLKLNLVIKKLVMPDGKTENINKSLGEYNSWLNKQHRHGDGLPQIVDFQYNSIDKTNQFFLTDNNDGKIGLYSVTDNSNILVASAPINNLIEINAGNYKLTIYWPAANDGAKFYFVVYDDISAFDMLSNKIVVAQKDNTNLLEIKVRDKSPENAQIIAATVVNKFRETRTEQQRQNAQSSYASIDSQLTEMSKKLKNAEDRLSDYQASTGIMNIDQNSNNAVNALSSLEAEKISNQLLLGQYEEKERQLNNIYDSKGYFDQTYLSPAQTTGDERAFTNLLQQLSDLEVKKIELLQKETEQHPDVISINSQIAQIKKQLSGYNQNTLTAYKIIINSLKDKDRKLNSLVGNYRSKIKNLPQKETVLAGLIRDKDVTEKVFNLLLDKREELRAQELAQLQDVVVVDQASLPVAPVSPNRNLTLILCVLLWGIISIVYVAIGELRERKYIKLEEIEDKLKLPLLSIIPAFSGKLRNKIDNSGNFKDRFPVLLSDNPGIAESYKVLQTKLTLNSKNPSKIIMFSSCEENTGKTTLVANLALSLVAAHKKVLVVDADLKRCGLSDLFQIPRDFPGLSTFLEKDLKAAPVMNLSNMFGQSSSDKLLSILPAGDVNENSSELFQSPRTVDLINALKSSIYDYVLIDTPPITRVVDSLILGKLINNLVMIVRYNYSLNDSFYWGINEIRKEKIKILGIVANACDIEKSAFRHKYGYGYGYKYAYTPSKTNKKKKKFSAAI